MCNITTTRRCLSQFNYLTHITLRFNMDCNMINPSFKKIYMEGTWNFYMGLSLELKCISINIVKVRISINNANLRWWRHGLIYFVLSKLMHLLKNTAISISLFIKNIIAKTLLFYWISIYFSRRNLSSDLCTYLYYNLM